MIFLTLLIIPTSNVQESPFLQIQSGFVIFLPSHNNYPNLSKMEFS